MLLQLYYYGVCLYSNYIHVHVPVHVKLCKSEVGLKIMSRTF